MTVSFAPVAVFVIDDDEAAFGAAARPEAQLPGIASQRIVFETPARVSRLGQDGRVGMQLVWSGRADADPRRGDDGERGERRDAERPRHQRTVTDTVRASRRVPLPPLPVTVNATSTR